MLLCTWLLLPLALGASSGSWSAAAASCDSRVFAATGCSASAADCAVCAGHHQHQLRRAGCDASDIQRFCSRPSPSDRPTVWASATTGSDSHDGQSPDSAVRTLDRALVAVRKLGATWPRLLLDGTFRLEKTVFLNPYSATNLLVDCWPGRPAATLSGGQLLPAGGWTAVGPSHPGVWRTALSPALAAALDGAGE
jgi:hypothetical protein